MPINMNYPVSREDYYPVNFELEDYKKNLELFTSQHSDQYLFVDNHQFRWVSLLEKIFQTVKGWFGFTNKTAVTRINSELLKFLYYGEIQGFMHKDEVLKLVKKLKEQHESPKDQTDQKVKAFVKQIFDAHQTPGQSIDFPKLQGDLADYHKTHRQSLRPGFWYRLFFPPLKLPATQFGDTHLAVALQQSETGNVEAAWNHFMWAKDEHNHSLGFQARLAEGLVTFLETEKGQPYVKNQEKTVKPLLMRISPATVKTHNYSQGEKVLKFVLENFTKQPHLKALMGESCLMQHKYQEAAPYLSDLELAIVQERATLANLGEEEKQELSSRLSALYHELSLAYSDDQKSVSSAEKALKCAPENPLYREALFQAYLKRAKEYRPSLVSNLITTDNTAFEYYEKAYKINPERDGEHIQALISFYEKDEARLDEAVALHEKWPETEISAKSLYKYGTNHENSLVHLQQAWERCPNSDAQLRTQIGEALLPSYLEAAEANFSAGDLVKAKTAYTKAHELCSHDNEGTIQRLIIAYEQRRSPEMAVFLYEKWNISTHEISSNTYASYGQQQLQDAKYQEAMNRFEKADTLSPSDDHKRSFSEASYRYALQIRETDPQQASNVLQKAWDLSPSENVGRALAPLCLTFGHNADSNIKKMEWYEKVLTYDPENEECKSRLFALYLEEAPKHARRLMNYGPQDLYIQYYTKAYEVQPDTYGAHIQPLIAFYENQRNYQMAITLYEKWPEQTNISANTYYEYGRQKQTAGQHLEALKLFQKADQKTEHDTYKAAFCQACLDYHQTTEGSETAHAYLQQAKEVCPAAGMIRGRFYATLRANINNALATDSQTA